MNDAWGYEENQQNQQPNGDGPKALREAYEAQKKMNEEILAKLEAIETERAREKVSSVFSELGVPDAAKLYTGEPDPEKAKAWAETMKATFGTSNTQSQTQASDTTQASPFGDAQTQQQFQQMTEAGQGAAPIGNFQAAQAAVGTANDLESLMAAMNAAAQHNPG